MPVSILAALRFRTTAAVVEQIVARRRWLTAEGETLSAALYGIVGTEPDVQVRRRLLRLRRAVHQLRTVEPHECDSALLALPPQTARRLRHWFGQLHEWHTDQAGLAAVVADETTRQEAVLRAVAADPGFRRAMWQASAALSDQLDRWLADERYRPRRTVLFRLAKYLSRAATKTSPYSTFTVSGLGAWVATGAAVQLTPDSPPRGVLELHGRVRQRLVRALAVEPGLWDVMPVRVNPSLTEHTGRLRFLGRQRGEPVMSLPATPSVMVCIRILREGHAQTMGELRARLLVGGSDAASVTRFLTHLADVGLLDASPHMGYRAGSLAALASWLSGQSGTRAAAAAELVDRIEQQLTDAGPVADVAGHRGRQLALRATVDTLSRLLGMPTDDGAAHRPVAQESVVLPPPAVRCAEDVWRAVLDDLDVVRRWLAVYNPVLTLRLALTDFWVHRFGAGTRQPFLSLHCAVHEEIAAGTATGVELQQLLRQTPFLRARDDGCATVRSLRQLQDEATEPFRWRPGHDPSLVQVAPADLARIAAGWPSWVQPATSLSCYVQPLPGPGTEQSVILNNVATGFGWGRSRIVHLTQRSDERSVHEGRSCDRGAVPEGDRPVFADLVGSFASSMNDRVPTLQHEIIYPFTDVGQPAARQIDLGDLLVVHDPEVGLLRLTSVHLDVEVKALHLGLLTPMMLPPAAQLLVEAFGETAMGWPGLALLDPETDLTAPQAVTRTPRIAVGRVILRRARWILPSGELPRRRPAESDAEYLIRLAVWRDSHAIPTRCFVRAWVRPGLIGDSIGDGQHAFDKNRKPIYIDFDNWFLVLAFEHMIRPLQILKGGVDRWCLGVSL